MRLGGRLFGKANSRRPIVIQARAVGSRRWATVRVVRTQQNGRFSMRYRFLSTFKTVTYIFRAQARSANGYPYATGTSARGACGLRWHVGSDSMPIEAVD